jgi:tRNA-intron endonuclease
MVYRELRKRGFLIRDDGFMYIWRGGEQKEKGEMKVFPVDEKSVFDFSTVYSMAGRPERDGRNGYSEEGPSSSDCEENPASPNNSRSEKGIGGENSPLIFAIVDGDGDVTYYSISRHFPKGPHNREIRGRYTALLLDDMGIMLEGHDELHSLFYGKKMDDALYLSTFECIYLIKKNVLKLKEGKKRVTASALLKRTGKKDPEIERKMVIYSDLRDRGLIVRTGFKYGTHFRVYVKDVEQHARYLAHAVAPDYKGTWPEISRGVRLAHGVKKEFIMAEASKKPRYLRIKRVRL